MILTTYSIKFRTAVLVFIVASVVFGLFSYSTMPREGAPDITIPYVFVAAPYEGTAPAEIENLITIPLEKKFKDLENVKQISSVSAEGVSSVVIEFTPKENLNNALQRVKDKIDMARPDLPRDLEQPIVDVINFSTDMPIVNLALSGDNDTERLKKLAEDIQDQIEAMPGVREAPIFGTMEREIRVEIDPARLVTYRLTLGAVMYAIARENATISAGNLEMSGGKFQVRVPGEFKLVSDMKDIVVANIGGKAVYLTDVATIRDTHKDLTTISRINGEPCVSMQIKKRSGENTLGLIHRVKRLLKTYRLPAGVKLTYTSDQSEFIGSMVQELENGIVSGSLLVIAVLLLSMGWRNSVFVGLAIPLSMLISFIVMDQMQITLNMIVLFGLVMATGMLVDDAIVIVENVFRHRSQGASRVDAALKGTAEVAWPVIASTFTAAAAFWPLLLWPGIMGQFMKFLPLTLILTRMASLVVALMINPVLCTYYISPERKRVTSDGRESHPILEAYENFLRSALKYRGVAMAIGLAFLVLTILLFGRLSRGVELFPDTEPRLATVVVKYPQGTHLEKTDATLRAIEAKLLDTNKYADIRYILSTAGSEGNMFGASSQDARVGSIIVEFVKASERHGSTMALVQSMRDDIGLFPGADIRVEREKEGPPTGAPVSIEVSGEDFDTLSFLASEITRATSDVNGLVDVRDDFEEARPELQFVVDRQRAGLLGLNTDTIGLFLRTSIYGTRSSKFRAGEDEYDITVRLPENVRNTADFLDQTRVPLDNGNVVPLSSLGRVSYTGGRGDIIRKDQKRVITISGDIQGRSIDAVLADVRTRVKNIALPPGYSVKYAGENNDMTEASTFLLKAFGIAMALIAIILVIEFNSVVLPLIILVAVFLAMVGVLWGLMICRMRFGVIMTGLGVITLAGIVVNNGIVLIDCIIHKINDGMPADEAIAKAARQRLRPVMLTAICTVLGLIPMAVGWNLEIHTFPWKFVAGAESSSWWAPMAVAVIFGLTLATVLTLVQVPIMFSLAESARQAAKRYFSRVAPQS